MTTPGEGSKVIHYGLRETGPDGSEQYGDYLADRGAAEQSATMIPQPGWSLEAVERDVTYGPWRPIGASARPYREPGDPPGPSDDHR